MDDFDLDEEQSFSLKQYIRQQKELIILDYELETKEKQKTEIKCIDLYFILRSKVLIGESKKNRKWTTTLPLPKNLIPPEYLIINDPTYVNVSDKMRVEFLDCGKDPIEGTVIKIKDGELTAAFELNWEEDTARHKCAISFLPNDIVYKRKLNSLNNLKYLNHNLQNMLCRKYPKKQLMPQMNLYLPQSYQFNESQKRAITMAVSNPFSLIQGPPGTGKTHTIGAIAIQALKNEPNKKVLICGTTNVSINSLLEIVGDMVQSAGFQVCWPAASARDFLTEDGLTKEQKLMTLYKSRHMDSDDSRRFKELNDKYNPSESEISEMKRLREKLENQIIRESNVIFSTLDSSGKKSIATNIGAISTLIVDEATLSVESSMIIPLALCPDRFVLVGDHKQLGPQPSFEELKRRGYYCSMFERIIKEKSCLKNSIMLNTQYRMHPDISYLPNKLFYDNELIDGVNPDERKIQENFIFQKHLNFINFNHDEEKNGTSYINHEEISQVLKFVNCLIDCGVQHSQIGVISAYGAQTHLISENFKWNNVRVKVSTIDSFQGSQKDYIIICTTRNGKSIGFLNDKRRMNVAITRARRLVTIFGNADSLSKSSFWNEVIEYTKENKSYYERLPIKIEKMKQKSILISTKKDDFIRELVSEFKEEPRDAGYKLNEIDSPISDSKVRILWPDEDDDIEFLSEWVEERVEILKKKKFVTLAYDAEGVCLQFGDIFDYDVDYYNWESSDNNVPEIKLNESIIISFYQHKGDFSFDQTLVNIMKPLLEHQNITFITFDFTYDFNKLNDFGIKINTKRIIDVQLMMLPEDSLFTNTEDFISSTGWRSIGEFIMQACEDNVNANLILRAKQCVKNGKKKFPHEENNFLIKQFNYPAICKFTKLFIEYSANDIFYTAIAGVDVLSRCELDDVKERSAAKFKSYNEYREKYGSANNVRQAFYVRESFTSAIQAQFSKENKTYQIISYHKKLNTFVSLLDNCPQLLQDIIPSFTEDDSSKIRQRYNEIVQIMKNPEYTHLGNIKDKAMLAHVQGIPKNPAFVLRFKEEIDEALEEIKQENKIKKEKENHEKDAVFQITGGKNQFKDKSNVSSAWKGLDISKPIKSDEKFTPINVVNKNQKNKHNTIKSKKQENQQVKATNNIKPQSPNTKAAPQQEKIVIKTVHSAWTNFTQTQEDESSNKQKGVSQTGKQKTSKQKKETVSLPFIPEFKQKQLHSSWTKFSNSQKKS